MPSGNPPEAETWDEGSIPEQARSHKGYRPPVAAPQSALVSRRVGSDRVDVVVLNSAPIALAGRVVETRRVILDRDPFARHRYESSIIRQFADFRLVERRHFARRYGHG